MHLFRVLLNGELNMFKTKRIVIIFISVVIAVVLSCLLFTACVTPTEDKIKTDGIPSEYMIISDDNFIEYQKGNDCSAYASAYVMRNLGNLVKADDIYPDIKRRFGFVSASSIVELFKEYGYNAKAYQGDINTLKRRLNDGIPIIVFTSITKDTHYIVAVGYDEQYIYLVDSISDNVNSNGRYYNRKLKTEEFEKIWKTNVYFASNIYIVADRQKIK